MRRKILILSVCVLIVGSVVTRRAARAQQLQQHTLNFQGIERTYYVHLPDGWDGSTAAPLLVGLHGGGGSAISFGTTNGFNEVADREGFVVVYPDAVENVWNDGRDVPQTNRPGVDDVGFLSELIDVVSGDYAIDPTRVYATGTSNGGMMSQRLALEMGRTDGGNRLAGFAPIVANLPADLLPVTTPVPRMHALITVGTADPLMPFEGGQVSGGRGGPVLSSDGTRDFWLRRMGLLGVTPTVQSFPDVSPNDGVVTAEFYDSQDSADLAYYVIDGGGHAVPGSTSLAPDLLGFGPTNRDISAAEEIWSFFSTRPLVIPEPSGAGLAGAALGVAVLGRRRGN